MEIRRTVTVTASGDDGQTMTIRNTNRDHRSHRRRCGPVGAGLEYAGRAGCRASRGSGNRCGDRAGAAESGSNAATVLRRGCGRDRPAGVHYRHIDDSVQPPAFYDALSILTSQTHHTKLDYSPSIELYPEVDLQPNGKIQSIYSARQMDPETLIRADADVDRARRAAFRVLADSGTLSAEDVTAIMSRLEASFTYNCEHVVPQSWFAKRLPMKGDLHHLFGCEIKCNELRANIPYFDFTPDHIQRPDCGRAEPGRFEPVGGKGAVARGTLYFLLRYPSEIDSNDREYHA